MELCNTRSRNALIEWRQYISDLLAHLVRIKTLRLVLLAEHNHRRGGATKQSFRSNPKDDYFIHYSP